MQRSTGDLLGTGHYQVEVGVLVGLPTAIFHFLDQAAIHVSELGDLCRPPPATVTQRLCFH